MNPNDQNDPNALDQLIAVARVARQLAYAPYSNFAVGAGVESRPGPSFPGCNV